jgi:hypothetical protein
MSKDIDENKIRESYKNHPLMRLEDIVDEMGEYMTEIVAKVAEWTAFNEDLRLKDMEGIKIGEFFSRFDTNFLNFLNGLLEEMGKSKMVLTTFLENTDTLDEPISKIDFATWMRINAKLAREHIKDEINNSTKKIK